MNSYATRRLMVIGAGYAGVLAANRAARAGRGRVKVLLVNPTTAFRERIRQHQQLAAGRAIERPLSGMLHPAVEHVCDHAESIDVVSARVVLRRGGTLPYDAAIAAVGSHEQMPTALASAWLWSIRGRRGYDACPLRRHLAQTTGPLVIVGGGFTGIETAAALARAHRGRKVVLVTTRLAAECEVAAPAIAALLQRQGVVLAEGSRVEDVGPRHVVIDGRADDADAVIAATGFAPAGLPLASGVVTDNTGRARVGLDLRAQLSAGVPTENLWFVGDAAALSSEDAAVATAGQYRAWPMGCKLAMPMGAYAADAAIAYLGHSPPPPPFRFRDAISCVEVGSAGVVARHREAGLAAVSRGYVAGWVKRAILRFTVLAILGQRRGLPYAWPQPRANLLLAAYAQRR